MSDECGNYLKLPDELWDTDPERCRATYDAFREWESQACAHPYMHAARERIANASQLAAFRLLVEEQGGLARYPMLSEQLPEYNGGNMPASLAPALLRELAELAAGPDQTLVMLREQKSGNVVYTVRRSSQELFVFTGRGRYQYGLDEAGFFIVEEIDGLSTVRFRSGSFVQQRLGAELFCFIDLEAGHRYECNYGLQIDDSEDSTATFELVYETLPLAQIYAHPLTSLRTVTTAAIATGNPICWV